MNKARLAEALGAAKAIKQGFDINAATKVTRLDSLYTVHLVNRRFQIDPPKVTADDADDERVQILSIQFNQEANVLAAGDSNGRVQLFDVFSGKTLDTENSRLIQETNMPAMSVKWHPMFTNILYFTNANGIIGSFNREKLQMNVLAKEKNETNCIDINDGAKFLGSVGSDSRIRIYDLNNFELAQTYASADQNIKENFNVGKNDVELDENAHTNRLFSIKFDKAHADMFYTGGWDRNVKIWDRRLTKGIAGSLYGPNICADGIDVKGHNILTSSWVKKDSLQLWDLRNFKNPIRTLPLGDTPDGEYIYMARFADVRNEQNNLVLACGSGTKGVHLIDYEKSQHIAKLNANNAVNCIDSVYSGCIFACGSMKSFQVGISKV